MKSIHSELPCDRTECLRSERSRVVAAWIATPIVLVWCSWFLLGVAGHVFPDVIGDATRMPETQRWPKWYQFFPSFDLVDQSLVVVVTVAATALLICQLLAMTLHSRRLGLVVGLAFILLGLPMLGLRILVNLFPFGKIDPGHDFVWDTLFPFAMYGTWTAAGALMIHWSLWNIQLKGNPPKGENERQTNGTGLISTVKPVPSKGAANGGDSEGSRGSGKLG